MNTKQIIAELRRSACEDADPFEVMPTAFSAACHWKKSMEFLIDLPPDDPRTFYLLVAEAMKSERKEKQNEQATKSA